MIFKPSKTLGLQQKLTTFPSKFNVVRMEIFSAFRMNFGGVLKQKTALAVSKCGQKQKTLGKAGCFFHWRFVCGIIQDEFADARHNRK